MLENEINQIESYRWIRFHSSQSTNQIEVVHSEEGNNEDIESNDKL